MLGDARLRLREAPDHAYRLIVLDAFSSDSLPVHLVTREAIRLYRSKLAEGGVLAFNLSNRYLDLDPLMGRQAEDAGLVCRIGYDTAVSAEERQAGKQPSIWAVMAATRATSGSLASDDPRGRRPRSRPGSRAWTDDYSDLARYLRWMPPHLAKRSMNPAAREVGCHHDTMRTFDLGGDEWTGIDPTSRSRSWRSACSRPDRSAMAGEGTGWNPQSAARYLDAPGRGVGGVQRAPTAGKGTDKVSCLSCHTSVSYALGRPRVAAGGGRGSPVGPRGASARAGPAPSRALGRARHAAFPPLLRLR